jgi:hypothetical protein
MNKLIFSAAVAAVAMFSSSAFAVCPGIGEVTRVSVLPGAGATQIWVRQSSPIAPTFAFTTTDAKVVSGAVAAQGSHERVRVIGSATTCPPASLNLVPGGNVNEFVIAPEL